MGSLTKVGVGPAGTQEVREGSAEQNLEGIQPRYGSEGGYEHVISHL